MLDLLSSFFAFIGYYAIGGLGRFLVESALLISQVGKSNSHKATFYWELFTFNYDIVFKSLYSLINTLTYFIF